MPSTMWASAALPILSGEHRIGRRHKNSSLPSPPSPAALAQLHCQNITDLLEPAIDGPPSPESIRAFSQQMRQSSVQDKHQSRHTSSSGSSSLLSLVSSGRPSWEHAFEGPPALSRRSSGRSTNSIMQAPSLHQRERADSVQLFGKNIFNRKSRLRRDSSAQSFASSSVYSSDVPPDVNSAASGLPAANIIPSLFSRRRTQRPGSLATDSGRPLISGPYNFQHVTHTDKERLNSLQRSSSAILQTELSTICTSQVPSSGALKGIQAESLRFPDFVSAENLATLDEDSTVTMGDNISPRTSISRRSSQTRSPPRRSSMKASRSQELLSGQTTPPVPPPRVSSRLSVVGDSIDGCIIDRPQTSTGISERLVESIQEDGGEEEDDDDEDDGLQMRSGFRESYVLPTEYRFSRILSVGAVAPEDTNWPLISPTNTTFDSSLADVPEEEEHVALSQTRSRLSIISTHSSLRGSNSVPLLRQLSLRQAAASTPRPRAPSNASETLGRFDLVGTQPAPSDVPEGGDASEFLSRESWEDDIDYCYEHEVEADCNYAWERPSIDLSRDDGTATPVDLGRGGGDDDNEEAMPASPMGLHPGSHYDLPALSPASPVSSMNTAVSEAFTPVSAVAPTANFSLPRGGSDVVLQPLVVRTDSAESTFKESQGFNLSPSLLIPGSDYHRQMHMLDDDRQWYQQEDDSVLTFLPYQEPVLSMDRSALLAHQRTSASTVASSTADSADLHQRRHDSTASAASTALTDMTRSTSSVNVQGLTGAPGESAASVEERRNFSHILPASPRKTKDDAAAAATGSLKPSKLQKEPASAAPTIPAPSPPPMLRRRRAKTAGYEARPALARPSTAPFPSYSAYNLALSRI